MKIVHIADTHLGLAACTRLDPESGMNLRERQIYDNFLAAIDAIVKERPDVLVHAGDLFETVKPKTRAYTTVTGAPGLLNAPGKSQIQYRPFYPLPLQSPIRKTVARTGPLFCRFLWP